MKRKITSVIIALLFVAVLASCVDKSVVLASDEPPANRFSGDVGVLKHDNSSYVMQVTVENHGEDFSGTVQVIMGGSGYDNCAYNTYITLPEQGKKQFTINVTERSVDTVRGLCAVNFLDEKEKLLQSISLSNVFGNEKTGISVGILSDNYSGLTFMDAGGEEFTVQGITCPLKLVELNNDNLKEYLDGLYFMVIDQFNVSELSKDNIQEIQDWVSNGGWLLIGTGAYAEQTLSGFDEDFIHIDILSISEPGEKNALSVNPNQYGYYYNYQDNGIDFEKVSVANLNNANLNAYSYESYENPALIETIGSGVVEILYFSLGEKELQKMGNYTVRRIYEELMESSNSYNMYNGYSDMKYAGRRLLRFIDSKNTEVDFTWLEVLIGIYVVLIGPILYLILRKCRKSELYWIFVPVLGLIFIAGVFLFGKGARVNDTIVYSVTVQKADSNREDTYFLAYHSGVKKWSVSLNENYEIAGPGWDEYYSMYSRNVDNYHYIVNNDGNNLSVGLKPDENFENAFLYAGGKTESKGSITGTGITFHDDIKSISGTVVNNTEYDMPYMAVRCNTYVMIFSDVKAGETLDLRQASIDGRCVYQNNINYYDDYLYSMVGAYRYSSSVTYEQDDMAALSIGIGIAEEAKPVYNNYATITGVIKDYKKAVAGKCKETSYGCLYSYAEMEVEGNASY